MRQARSLFESDDRKLTFFDIVLILFLGQTLESLIGFGFDGLYANNLFVASLRTN